MSTRACPKTFNIIFAPKPNYIMLYICWAWEKFSNCASERISHPSFVKVSAGISSSKEFVIVESCKRATPRIPSPHSQSNPTVLSLFSNSANCWRRSDGSEISPGEGKWITSSLSPVPEFLFPGQQSSSHCRHFSFHFFVSTIISNGSWSYCIPHNPANLNAEVCIFDARKQRGVNSVMLSLMVSMGISSLKQLVFGHHHHST